RDGEAAILVHWIREGKLDKKAYEDDLYRVPESMKDMPITPDFVEEKDGVKYVTINNLISKRCVRCHTQGKSAGFAPLDEYEFVRSYGEPEHTGGMPLRKLAQSTHVHLLGFSMLYMLTGVIFACSNWPGIFRLVIAPLALVAQVV